MEDSIPYDIAKRGRSIVVCCQTGNIWLTGVQSKAKENWLIIERKLRQLKAGRGALGELDFVRHTRIGILTSTTIPRVGNFT